MRRKKLPLPPTQMTLDLRDPRNKPPPAPQSFEVMAAIADLLLRATSPGYEKEIEDESEDQS